MECEVCGKEVWGEPYRAFIDGAKLIVCHECAQFTKGQKSAMLKRAAGKSITRIPTLKSSSRVPSKLHEGPDLVEGFGRRIRTGRMKLKLNHEELSRKIGVKVSTLQKLETEKMVPDLALGKRLEQFLKINIFGPSFDSSKSEEVQKKPSELTLGDVVVIHGRVEEEVERGQ